MHTLAFLFVCLFSQILSALIRFLSTGTGFSVFLSGFLSTGTGILKDQSGFLSTGTGIPADYQISGSLIRFGHLISLGSGMCNRYKHAYLQNNQIQRIHTCLIFFTTDLYAHGSLFICLPFLPDFICLNPVSYQPEPEFGKVIPVSYQPEPEFRQSTGIPVLNPVPVVP